MKFLIMIVIIGAVLLSIVKCCKVVKMNSEVMGSLVMSQIPLDNKDGLNVLSVGSGRPSYIAYDSHLQKSYYLYHVVSPDTFTASWTFNDEFGVTGQAIAFRYSWAIAPHLIDFVNDEMVKSWIVPQDDTWGIDPSMKFVCIDDDSTHSAIYFESSDIQPTLTGFYVERTLLPSNEFKSSVYSHIPQHQSIENSFLFKLDGLWMIGENYGVDSAFAYVESSAEFPTQIHSKDWHFIQRDNAEEWSNDSAYIYHDALDTELGARKFPSVYNTVRFAHSIKFVPKGQKFVTLRNSVPVPVLGLGTGGIRHEYAHNLFERALMEGYRFYDLARKYENEHILPEVLDKLGDKTPVTRENIFIQSKVWPTDLGFHPTMDAILVSLDLLKTSYIDTYLIHWPRCIAEWDWMDCDQTVDSEGTWRESWRALEKAYSEGLVNSIGVSNFDASLMHDLLEFAIIRPHFVQNFAEPGRLDNDVRKLCKKHNIIYQPYASGRNIDRLPDHIKSVVDRIAQKYSKTPYAVVLRFFLQTGSLVVIPRTNNPDHLKENTKVFEWSLETEDMEALGWKVNVESEL